MYNLNPKKPMKKIIIAVCLLFISVTSSYGQWYFRKYHVTNINSLSIIQLQESLKNSKTGLRGAILIGAGGGVLMGLLGVCTLYLGFGDNPSRLAELLGSEFMGRTYLVIGAGLFAGGTIASIAYIGRIGRIKSVIRKNYPYAGSLNISPAIILDNSTRSYCPGFTLTFNF